MHNPYSFITYFITYLIIISIFYKFQYIFLFNNKIFNFKSLNNYLIKLLKFLN